MHIEFKKYTQDLELNCKNLFTAIHKNIIYTILLVH
jgi:hypothetical protein